jgi:hypothetical protein
LTLLKATLLLSEIFKFNEPIALLCLLENHNKKKKQVVMVKMKMNVQKKNASGKRFGSVRKIVTENRNPLK